MFPALFYVHRWRKHTKSCVIESLITEEYQQTIKSKQSCVACWKHGGECSDNRKYHQRWGILHLGLGSASWRRENRTQFEESVVIGRKTQSGNRVHEKNRTFLGKKFCFVFNSKEKEKTWKDFLTHQDCSFLMFQFVWFYGSF